MILRSVFQFTIVIIIYFLLVFHPVLFLAQTTNQEDSQILLMEPPFSGTIFIDPDIINSTDPTTFQSVSYIGQDSRMMFDRRVNAFITLNAYLFNASFDDGLSIEIQVNPEFGNPESSLAEVQKYAPVIGQLPTALRADVETVWIHKGVEPFGGGNNNLLIHVDQAELYIEEGILEETLVHEASHTSLDAYYAASDGWLAAQTADNEFISTYARDYPDLQDVAESFLPYLAVRYKSERISPELYEEIMQTIPNRIAYFDAQELDMYPLDTTAVDVKQVSAGVPNNYALIQNYPNPFNPVTKISFNLPQTSNVSLKVYNLLGKEVELLAFGNYPPGKFEVNWDATGLSSGVYIYRLEAEGVSITKRMILLK